MPRSPEQYRRSLIAIAALFAVLGFQYATWASRLPALKARLHLNPAQVGVLLMVCGVGAAASLPLVTTLMRRLGSGRLAMVSGLCLVAVLPALAAAPDYPVAIAVLCFDGVAVACFNVAMNAQGAALEAFHGRTVIARLHATFSGGSFAAALLASAVAATTSRVSTHFAVACVVILLLLAGARAGLLRGDRDDGGEGAGSVGEGAGDAVSDSSATEPAPSPAQKRRLPLLSRLTVWMGIAMVFGTVTEGAMNDWSALYLKDVARSPAEVVPLGIAVVSVMMVIARMLADGWRTRFGDGRVVAVGSAVAAAGLASAIAAGGTIPALAGFACVGAGMAAVTPCIYAAAARQGPAALALIATTGTIGLLLGPAMIGFINNACGLRWGMYTIAAAAGTVTLSSARNRWTSAAPSSRQGERPDAEDQSGGVVRGLTDGGSRASAVGISVSDQTP